MSKKPTATKSGLDVELHPLLRGISTPSAPKNPLKRKVRDAFDENALNPYLDTASGPARRKRELIINPKGKFEAQADSIRQKIHEENLRAEEERLQREKGHLPDDSLAESNYRLTLPPVVEWWDKPYLSDQNLYQLQLVLDNSEQPITQYIQHPVFVTPEEDFTPEEKIILTSKERKRLRKNTRLEALKEKQDRIKLGLDPPPPPKVKLANLMNVLTNEAIQDPTAVEMRVRQEVDARLQQHLQDNEARKLTKEERHTKEHLKRERDLQKGCICCVFRVESLANKKHSFKVDINAKQVELSGVCLINPKYNLIIVEGGSRATKFYKKLLLNRINWKEPPNDSSEPVDLSKNRCTLIWEGEIPQKRFQKWSMMYSRDENEALAVLEPFGASNYWNLARTI